MEAYLLEWLNLLGRWVHTITGIAWIGASFYFVWLDNHLLAPRSAEDAARGVGGEIWSVHGGGFYHAQKYRVAPSVLPETLHWFKWEAYTTWISGVFLLALVYWYGAEVYLVDPGVFALGNPAAIALGAGTLLVGWVVYDGLCRSPLGKHDAALWVVIFVLVAAAAWGLCQVFSGRGAYIHFGAMLGTIMVANVYFVIIPGQKELVAAKREGRDPDPIHGARGKQRSVHNTYFTLPVLFVMVSNHYATTYGHAYNWLILIAISLAGALIRLYFVMRHAGPASPWPLWAGGALLAVLAAAIAPAPAPRAATGNGPAATLADVEGIVARRCVACHATTPTQPGFSSAPKGIVLESAADIRTNATVLHRVTVLTKTMPIGNLTRMTAAERNAVDTWFRSE